MQPNQQYFLYNIQVDFRFATITHHHTVSVHHYHNTVDVAVVAVAAAVCCCAAIFAYSKNDCIEKRRQLMENLFKNYITFFQYELIQAWVLSLSPNTKIRIIQHLSTLLVLKKVLRVLHDICVVFFFPSVHFYMVFYVLRKWNKNHKIDIFFLLK